MFINCIIKINKHLQTSLNAPKRGLSKYSKVTIFKYIFKYSDNFSETPSIVFVIEQVFVTIFLLLQVQQIQRLPNLKIDFQKFFLQVNLQKMLK